MAYLVKVSDSNLVEPDLNQGVRDVVHLPSFSFVKRLDGNESIEFSAFETELVDALEEGQLYYVYADPELTKLLPATFLLQTKELMYDGFENFERSRLTAIKGISIAELLNRTKVTGTYRNKTVRQVLTKLLDFYRLKIPQIDGDYSFIDDVDYTFTRFARAGITMQDVFEIIKNLGFQCFLRPDFKVQCGERTFLNEFVVNFDEDSIGGQINVLQRSEDSKISRTYKPLPYTEVVARGGIVEEGLFTARNVITSRESDYDLLNEVNIQRNFILEPFNTNDPENFDQVSTEFIGWNQRYLVYSDLADLSTYQMMEVGLQVLEDKPFYVLGLNDGNSFEPFQQQFGFYFPGDGQIQIIANNEFVNTAFTTKPFLEKTVFGVNNNLTQLTLQDVSGFEIGDIVQVSGTQTGLELAAGKIIAIDDVFNILTLDTPVAPGEINPSVRITRTTIYELRIIVDGNGFTNFYIKNGRTDFVLVHQAFIGFAKNSFITVYSALQPPSTSIGNGVWEVGGYAMDYFFFDRAKLIRVFTDNGQKLILCGANQADTVNVQAIVNNQEKDGIPRGQIQFFDPSFIKLVLNNPNVPITTTRIPIELQETDFIETGMRVLVNNESRLISSFLIDARDGYIDLNEPLTNAPEPLSQVWINTSIPINDTVFFVEYVPVRTLEARDRLQDEQLFQRFGWREPREVVKLDEYNDAAELAARLKLFLEEEIRPRIKGEFTFQAWFGDCARQGVYNTNKLPTIGEYILVTDSKQGIFNEPARIEGIAVQGTPDEGLYNVRIELSELSSHRIVSELVRIQRQLGVVEAEAGNDFPNLSLIKRDSLAFQEGMFEVNNSPGYPFYSGQYVVNYSGNAGTRFVNAEEFAETFSLVETTGYPFYSGQYSVNYSGNRGIVGSSRELILNGSILSINGSPLVLTYE